VKKTLLLLLISAVAYAQREVQYAQYLLNPLAINPAFAGTRETFHFNAILRRQFIAGVQGLPVTQSFAMDGAVANGKIGLGLQGLNDRVSLNTAVYAMGAYHYQISETQKISIGVLGGINVLPVRDAFNFGGAVNRALASAGAGIYYEDEFYFGGISMPEILKQTYSYSSSLLNYQRPVFVQAGVKLLPTDDWEVRPSVLLTKPEQGKLRADLNCLATFKEKLTLGVSVRLGSTTYWQGIAQYDLSKNFKVGYVYASRRVEDFSFVSSSVVPGAGRGIHELVITLQPNPHQ
jgi:type IX secretion system PorP/SprF family membrane protein